MFRNNYSKEYCYTLKEFVKRFYTQKLYIEALDVIPTVNELIGLSQAPVYFQNWSSEQQEFWGTGYGKKLWEQIYHKHFHDACIFSEKKVTLWKGTQSALDLGEEAREFVQKFIYTFNNTKEKYIVLLDAYTSKKDELLSDIRRIEETKFNDTPQNSGTFEDDEHMSNYTKHISSDNAGTALQRLDEIERLYKNILEKWQNEFDNLFISTLNFDEVKEIASSGSTATGSYNELIDKPSINGVTIEGTQTGHDLELANKDDFDTLNNNALLKIAQTLSDSEKKQVLNNIGIEYLYKEGISSSTVEEFVYTDISIEIPEGKIGIITAYIDYAYAAPEQIAICLSDKEMEGGNVIGVNKFVNQSYRLRVGVTTILPHGTYYVWGKWSNTAELAGNVVVHGILLNIGD